MLCNYLPFIVLFNSFLTYEILSISRYQLYVFKSLTSTFFLSMDRLYYMYYMYIAHVLIEIQLERDTAQIFIQILSIQLIHVHYTMYIHHYSIISDKNLFFTCFVYNDSMYSNKPSPTTLLFFTKSFFLILLTQNLQIARKSCGTDFDPYRAGVIV